MSNLCRRRCLCRAGRQAVASGADLLQALTAIAVVGVGCLGLAMLAPTGARAQSSGPAPQYSSAGAINLGGRGWSGSESKRAVPESAKSQLEFEVRGGLASDYIYRGVTLSDRRPAAGMAIEATYDLLYAGVTVASVRAADAARRRNIDERRHPPDIGTGRFRSRRDLFPLSRRNARGRVQTGSTTGRPRCAPRQSSARRCVSPADLPIRRMSPTPEPGAGYAAGGFGYDVPSRFLPPDIGVSFTAAAGYSWFGHQYAISAAFPCRPISTGRRA